MAAVSIQTSVLIIPNPEWPATDDDFDRVPSNFSFYMELDDNIRTLSTNTVSRGDDINGLLYVPDLQPSDPCRDLLKPFVPSNVTRQVNLPPTDYVLIALAPWISADCTLSYLEAARLDPVRAFLFYLTDHATSQPPLANDAKWGLHDGGQWKSDNRYPVYAIPGRAGDIMMNKLSRYSGNITDVQNGSQLSQIYDPRDFARLYTEISTGSRNTLPSLWVFLLIVLAILVVIVGGTSFAMHWIQRIRREALRRRVVEGEVDLEALGIKRLTVPREVLDQMPICTYVTESSTATTTPTQTTEANGKTQSLPTDNIVKATDPATTLPIHSSTHTFSQPTCPICLEDFQPGISMVRTLPCTHIFHPECVDDFLSRNSSLCPMCKKSVLPPGHCPRVITNNMVRRERNIRRMRERVSVPGTAAGGRTAFGAGRLASVYQLFFGRRRPVGPVDDAPPDREAAPVLMEMTTAPSPPPTEGTPAEVGAPPPVPSPATRRREWARRRANAMVHRRDTSSQSEESDEAREARMPRCECLPYVQIRMIWKATDSFCLIGRKAVKTVFPGFR